MSSASTSIYKDIQTRTGGDIYIGVVGPVRTGKSTFIKKFMDSLVIPNIEDSSKKERATDERRSRSLFLKMPLKSIFPTMHISASE